MTEKPKLIAITHPEPGVVLAEGRENGLNFFEGFDSNLNLNSTTILLLRNLVIDAAPLTASLKEWRNLKEIMLENVWVSGNFSRVYLPNLKKFTYHQFRNDRTDEYKKPEVLKQILFFDKNPENTWDLKKDLVNLNMSIKVTIEGTTILNIEPDSGEININTHDCEEYLENLTSPFPLLKLSLSWCSIGNSTIKKIKENSGNLQFLFLNNAVPAPTQLNNLTSGLKNLKELHIIQPYHRGWIGSEIFLNVSSLPTTLETLSVTNVDLSFEPKVETPFIRSLSLDQYITPAVVDNFTHIFPKVESIGLFNISGNLSYELIDKVLFQVKPMLVIVTNLTRQHEKILQRGHITGNTNQETDPTGKVELLLEKAGLKQHASSFTLQLKNGTYEGMELTTFQRNFFRFTRLALNKIDTYSDYVTWDAEPK